VDDDGSDEDDVDDLLMMESAFPVRRGVWQICTCASRGEIVPLYISKPLYISNISKI